mgnify:CR=1 FL=1
MTRPITWAAGSFLAIALAATFAGERLSRLSVGGEPVRAPEQPITRPVASGRPSGGDRALTIAPDPGGHFRVAAAVEGRHLNMIVDTGATIVALTHEDAIAAGIRPFPSDFTRQIATANGVVMGAPVRIRTIRVGDIQLGDIDGVVMPRGRLGISLLGMSFLRGLRGFEVIGGRLTLRG